MRKRWKAGILAFAMLAAFFLCIPVSQAVDYDTVRVKLSIASASTNVQLTTPYTLAEDGSTLAAGTYKVAVSGSSVNISGNGVNKTLASVTLKRTGSGYIKLTRIYGSESKLCSYLGNISFKVSGGKLLAVNTVSMQEYLYGVVGFEMSNSFPLEALKAQAVCARGYAAMRLKSSASDYDIGDTSSDQVYKGYDSTIKNVIRAVDETKGEVLTYNGKIITTYYAASNGGQTELPGNAWGNGESANKEAPYLAQHDDPYDLENASSKEKIVFIPSQVEGSKYDAVTSSGGKIVRVVNINSSCNVRSGAGTTNSIIGSAPVNAVYDYLGEARDKDGDLWYMIDYNGKTGYLFSSYGQVDESGRYTYGNGALTEMQEKAQAVLKSQGISVASPRDIKIITVNSMKNDKQQWPGTASRCYVTATANITVKYVLSGSSELSGAKAISVTLDLMNKNSSGKYVLTHDYLDSTLRMRGVSETSGGFNITCRRWGHGVGMSQRGAQTMAQNHNKGYREILAFYFVGTDITNLGSSDPTPTPTATPAPTPSTSGGASTPKLTSSKYRVGSSSITGLSENLSVSNLLSGLKAENGSVRVVTSGGAAKTSGNAVTGDVVQLYNSSGKLAQSFTVILYGDLNGDGKISLVDLLQLQKHLLGASTAKGASLTAADTSKDGKVTILDLLQLQKHLLGASTIAQ